MRYCVSHRGAQQHSTQDIVVVLIRSTVEQLWGLQIDEDMTLQMSNLDRRKWTPAGMSQSLRACSGMMLTKMNALTITDMDDFHRALDMYEQNACNELTLLFRQDNTTRDEQRRARAPPAARLMHCRPGPSSSYGRP